MTGRNNYDYKNEIEMALDDYRAGKMVVVVDDFDRENEGDLCMAAEKVTPQAINFMARYGRGLVCLSLTGERLDELELPLMVAPGANGSSHKTAFTVSIEAANGVTTGISAADRATTVLRAIHPDTRPSDLVRPGHIFPLRARSGGVLERRGHTEASLDMARMAGLYPGAVICEIMNSDGTMSRLPQLKRFARRHNLRIISIADLVKYRLEVEGAKPLLVPPLSTLKLVSEARLPTAHGSFRAQVYLEPESGTQFITVLGQNFNPGSAAPLVRIHSECLTGDVFGSLRCDCGPQLELALQEIARDGNGAVIYLPQEGRGIGLGNKIAAYALQELGLDTIEANIRLGFASDLREYHLAAAVLKGLGVKAVRLLTNNPHKIEDLQQNCIEVVERIPLQVKATTENLVYLYTKREKMGHQLELEAVSGIAN
jgi:3,4-dihydroxy 2-butanone 4-phosphate synthase/GTP cyclohydrolase II